MLPRAGRHAALSMHLSVDIYQDKLSDISCAAGYILARTFFVGNNILR